MGEALFSVGEVMFTPTMVMAFIETGDNPLECLERHQSGDWGDVDSFDKTQNDLAVKAGRRVVSVYRLSDGTRFYLITEWDRSATTFLLPEEY